MADDRSTPQGLITQAQVIGHASPPPPTPVSITPTTTISTACGQSLQDSPPRGPRTLLLRRSKNGFGFTLRHFIVYPPESCYMLPGHERTKIDEPMDTIFVKQVHSNSPAEEAGLRTGDRVVAVDGIPTRGEQYASVVQRISQANPWLRLLVVSKDDDILQRYFGETAHNPETNQRPRLRSPERLTQKQKRAIGMIPANAARARQSWICSPPGSENQGTVSHYGLRKDSLSLSEDQAIANESSTASAPALLQRKSLDDRTQRRASPPSLNQKEAPLDPTLRSNRYDLHDRTRPESIYSRTSSDRIYDRIQDPIYERVVNQDTGAFSESLDRHCFPVVARAEQQVIVPMMNRSGKRVVARRASEGSGPMSESDLAIYGSINTFDSRLSMGSSRRDSSPASKDSSLSSFDSNSTLTGGNEGFDNSYIMNRLKKSVEQKEEFLRRPSQPIGYLSSENPSVIQREFYARPQKLQRQVWPPNEFHQQIQQQQQPQQITRQRPIGYHDDRLKPLTRVSRVQNSMDSELEYNANLQQRIRNEQIESNRDRFYAIPYDNNSASKENNMIAKNGEQMKMNANSNTSTSRNSPSNKNPFITTLTRIHENVASAIQQNQDARNGTSSLPSSPGLDKKGNDKFPIPPQGLQIVSRRAKQFELGKLMSDDDEPTSDRTNLYKSELSRLSNKRSVPNVAVRKREFESKAETQEPRRLTSGRESKSLDGEPPTEMEPVRLRARSNSADSWGAVTDPSGRNARHTWQTESEENLEENYNKAKRQDSYLKAIRSQNDHRQNAAFKMKSSESDRTKFPFPPLAIPDVIPDFDVPRTTPMVTISPPTPVRPNKLAILNPLRPLENPDECYNGHYNDLNQSTQNDLDNFDVMKNLGSNEDADSNGVVRRQKNAQISDEDRTTRRVSYLKATWGERMHIDSDLELSDTEPVQSIRSSHKRWRPPLFPSDIAPLRRLFEEMTQGVYLPSQRHRNSILGSVGSNSGSGTPRDAEPIEREGSLHVKFTVLDGKRSTDRSWKQVWGVLRGHILYFYKDRHSQSPSTNGEGDTVPSVDTRCALVDIADDYTKRKHVLRITNSTAEVLLQTEDAASMALWLRAFKIFATEKHTDTSTNTVKQPASPQTPGPTSNTNQSGGQRLSPLPSHKGIRKLTSFRNRSPTGQSPVSKTRKPSQTVENLPSPKSKTWKGRMAKQFRKMHGQAGSPSSPTAQLPPEGATFKVPLELCPQSSFSEFVPLIVEICTSIVEARGLEVIGIYRVPGNTAAISQLTESVNKGIENINLQDSRWTDVNVISSLLKSFFRQLPDSLLTAELYPMFIDADKISDPQRRMATIRKLLRDLPEHHFETLKYLMYHLKKVVNHSEANKMEAKNLSIVFGPTLVRPSGSRDNMVTMVTEMKHQCTIVESLLNNVDWFFSEEDLDDLSRLSVNLSLPADDNENELANHSLLLNNIQKVEGMREMITARDIVSSIISAANRKIQRRRKGHEEPDNDDHEEEKLKGKQEENSPTVRQSMALNDRQCTVSEIVQMHENKGRPSERFENITTTTAITAGNGSGNNNSPPNNTQNSRGKYSKNSSANQEQEQQQIINPQSEIKQPSSSEVSSVNLDTISTVSNNSNDTKLNNDEVAIRTYTGLSATTQERIRKFEQETMTMLQRDQHRQRRVAERIEEERKRIEKEWQIAKSEMENDDILDTIADTTVTPNFLSDHHRLSNLNERLNNVDRTSIDLTDSHVRSKSSTRPIPLSIQQPPTARQKAQASSQLSNILGEKMNNGVIKKFKTDKEQSPDSNLLAPTRYGSLDSLHEIHGYSSSSPSQQHRGLPGDISDDAGSCFLHWTQKILTINKKLSRHAASPGFWCYISAHLHSAAGAAASGTLTKTPFPKSTPTTSNPFTTTTTTNYPTSLPIIIPAAESATTTAATTTTTTTSTTPSSKSQRPSSQLQFLQPGIPESGDGAVGVSSKIVNRILRGSDLLTSLTSTFDRKWKSLVNPANQSPSSVETSSIANINTQVKEEKPIKRNPIRHSSEYRDPSLHRSTADKGRSLHSKTDVPEKDSDSGIVDTTDSSVTDLPDNDRHVSNKKSQEDKEATCSTFLDASEKDESLKSSSIIDQSSPMRQKRDTDSTIDSQNNQSSTDSPHHDIEQSRTENSTLSSIPKNDDPSYTKKLKKFESMSQSEPRSRLKRSESLNKRTETVTSKLKRSESLNKHSSDRPLTSPSNGKLKRSESLNKNSDRSISPNNSNSKLKRSESLTKTEKTESNISKRRQSVRKESATKLKRKNGMPERSIKRRHTVGGTKDFDKVHWLDNKLQTEAEKIIRNDSKTTKKSQLRTSSPDLSSNRFNLVDTSFLIEVSFRGPSNVVFNVTNTRPQSLPDGSLTSKVYKVPLESHV
ncbi:uncharacterized protein LOC127276895 isoform X4 [Leptopilina boulardi]|uniref:uncharacterized protein LOC127276895 isoform X4 n=1 Tax=Leptopilina boulardi TaxID=63433 RepID=UPI0021F682C0|nr:uncharacterized protein LOC127276895 isoform X4 [Leptopilina boulardi]